MDHPASDPKHQPVSWEVFHRDTKILAGRLLGRCPWKGIVAVTRGGLVPAAIIARELDIRLIETVCLTSYAQEVKGPIRIVKGAHAAGDGEDWLMVDDLVDSGATAQEARRLLPNAYFATIYAKPAGKPWVHTFVLDFPQDVWLHFPWDCEPRYVDPLVGKD
jgi:adenine/guanine phosphoribosyltransferase-like PRPP-binding protein